MHADIYACSDRAISRPGAQTLNGHSWTPRVNRTHAFAHEACAQKNLQTVLSRENGGTAMARACVAFFVETEKMNSLLNLFVFLREKIKCEGRRRLASIWKRRTPWKKCQQFPGLD